MKIIYIFIILFIYFNIIYLLCLRLKNNTYIDIAWPIGFILSAISSFTLSNEKSIIAIITTTLILIHSSRLSYYLFKRTLKKEEDFRYRDLRKKHIKNFIIFSYIYIFMLQFILNFIIALPIIITNLYSIKLNVFSLIAIPIFITGFLFQVISDIQMNNFRNNKKNKGKLISTGLWKYSRHPNYFGEILIWWSFFFFSLYSTLNIFLIISPLTINFFIVKITGVPMLEKRLEGRSGWKEYKKNTNMIIPKF